MPALFLRQVMSIVSAYIVQRANLLALSISCCLLWVRVSFLFALSRVCYFQDTTAIVRHP